MNRKFHLELLLPFAFVMLLGALGFAVRKVSARQTAARPATAAVASPLRSLPSSHSGGGASAIVAETGASAPRLGSSAFVAAAGQPASSDAAGAESAQLIAAAGSESVDCSATDGCTVPADSLQPAYEADDALGRSLTSRSALPWGGLAVAGGYVAMSNVGSIAGRHEQANIGPSPARLFAAADRLGDTPNAGSTLNLPSRSEHGQSQSEDGGPASVERDHPCSAAVGCAYSGPHPGDSDADDHGHHGPQNNPPGQLHDHDVLHGDPPPAGGPNVPAVTKAAVVVAATPEPSTVVLLATGAFFILLVERRRRRSQAGGDTL